MQMCYANCVVLILVVISNNGLCRNNNIIRNRHPKHSALEYYTRPNQNLTVPIMIHIDKVLTIKLAKQYGPKTRQKLKMVSNKILQEVNHFYRPFIQRIHFKLLDTRFLKNNTKIVATDENVSKYLKSYCEWQREKKSNKWYYSVLLTGLDLFYLNADGKEIRRSTGRGYMGGMCNIQKSCALLEWHPKNIGYLLTHEIGHSLGMFHDGPPNNQCKGQGHIMAPKYNPKNHPQAWSKCSRTALKRYLVSKRSWCLRPDYGNNLTDEERNHLNLI